MTRCPVLLLFIVQTSLAYREDSFLDSPDSYMFLPDDVFDDNMTPIDNEKRNNHFLRFGRNDENYRNEYNDFDDFAKPTRAAKREKNDHFARFGRNQEFLRFGRDPEDVLNNKKMYQRIGRSIPEREVDKQHTKRETMDEVPPKENAYLRFGKNANFVRFGRSQPTSSIVGHVNKDMYDPGNNYQNLKLIRLLAEIKRRQKQNSLF